MGGSCGHSSEEDCAGAPVPPPLPAISLDFIFFVVYYPLVRTIYFLSSHESIDFALSVLMKYFYLPKNKQYLFAISVARMPSIKVPGENAEQQLREDLAPLNGFNEQQLAQFIDIVLNFLVNRYHRLLLDYNCLDRSLSPQI